MTGMQNYILLFLHPLSFDLHFLQQDLENLKLASALVYTSPADSRQKHKPISTDCQIQTLNKGGFKYSVTSK